MDKWHPALAGQNVKNIGWIILTLILVPFDTLVAAVATLCNFLSPAEALRRRSAIRKNVEFTPRNILVSGVGMSKGLALARSFHEAGHNVIGADFDELACGHMSRSLLAFYKLTKPNSVAGSAPYIRGLLDVVVSNQIDIWVSCSGVASAVEDGEAKEMVESKTSCKAIQFDVTTTQVLHEKHTFIERVQKVGLSVPDTHTITDQDQACSILENSVRGRKYIIKPIGMDDANRGDMTLLPSDSPEETARHLSKLRISTKSPWILQQYIRGPEYCTHALVVNGKVKVFVACPSAELLMHYEALPEKSKLSRAMLQFTQEFAKYHGEGFTGHLSFDFMIEETDLGDSPTLYPIECNPRAHTAVVLFNGTLEMAQMYLAVLPGIPEPNGDGSRNHIVYPRRTDRYYWVGHDLGEFLIAPMLELLSLRPVQSIGRLVSGMSKFSQHVLFWRDGTFEMWDPWPWWCLYHVYWPSQFWHSLRGGKRWSRINVSTTKIFEC